MAKASTGSGIRKSAKSDAMDLPPRKKTGATKAGKPAAAMRGTPKKSAAGKSAARQPAAKQAPTRMTGKTTTAKGSAKRRMPKQAAQPVVATRKAVAIKATSAKVLDTKTISRRKNEAARTSSAKVAVGKTATAKNATARLATAAPRSASQRRAVGTTATTPAARRARPATVPKRPAPAARKANAKPPHAFTVNHLDEADFKADGLREYAQYRDLGMAAVTAGLCQAHVIRFVPPCTDAVRKRHQHSVDLQLVYVLQGWIKNEFEGIGEQMMSTGSCWLQPSGIKHTVLDYSPDCEVLEIVVPADFKTEEGD